MPIQNAQPTIQERFARAREVARMSANLLRITLRDARTTMASYTPRSNPAPAQEPAIRLEALQCNDMLARHLGMRLPMPQEIA